MRSLSLVLNQVFLDHLGHESPLDPFFKISMKKHFASEIALHGIWQLHENHHLFNKSFQQLSKLITQFGISQVCPSAKAFSGWRLRCFWASSCRCTFAKYHCQTKVQINVHQCLKSTFLNLYLTNISVFVFLKLKKNSNFIKTVQSNFAMVTFFDFQNATHVFGRS